MDEDMNEKKRAYEREYYRKNKERIREYKKTYMKVYNKKYHELHKEEDKIRNRQSILKRNNESRKCATNHWNHWTNDEKEYLKELHSKGISHREIAYILGRTYASVNAMLTKLFKETDHV